MLPQQKSFIVHFIVSQTGWGRGGRPVTRNFVQESYTHVKTQFGGDLLKTWNRKMQINGLIELSNLADSDRSAVQLYVSNIN